MAVKMESGQDVGARLRALREEQGIPREQLALALRMGAENVRHYESGKTPLTLPMLPVVANLYGMTVTELVSYLFDVRATSNNPQRSDTGSDANRTANYIYTDGRRIEARVTRSVEYAGALGTRLQHVSLGLPIAAGVA